MSKKICTSAVIAIGLVIVFASVLHRRATLICRYISPHPLSRSGLRFGSKQTINLSSSVGREELFYAAALYNGWRSTHRPERTGG